jgi:hypothetical protein
MVRARIPAAGELRNMTLLEGAGQIRMLSRLGPACLAQGSADPLQRRGGA